MFPVVSRLLVVALVVALVAGPLVPPAAAIDRGLAIWTPSGFETDDVTGGEPLEEGATYELVVTVTSTVDLPDASVVASRSPLGVEVVPEIFSLQKNVPQALTVRLLYPEEFPKRLRRHYSTRLRVANRNGPLAGTLLIRTTVTDPVVDLSLSPPPPTQMKAGAIYVGTLNFSTSRPLAGAFIRRDRAYVTIGTQGAIRDADGVTRPITLTWSLQLQPGELGTVPITVTAPLRPQSVLHSANVRVLNRGQALKQPLNLRFNVAKVEAQWANRALVVNVDTGELVLVQTSVTLPGDLPGGSVRVKASDIASVTVPEGTINFVAGQTVPVTILVRAPFDSGNYLANVVVARGGELLDPPLAMQIRVRRPTE